MTFASEAGAAAVQISDVPACTLTRFTRLHVKPAPLTVTGWDPDGPAPATKAIRISPAVVALNAGVVAVVLPTVSTKTTLSTASAPGAKTFQVNEPTAVSRPSETVTVTLLVAAALDATVPLITPLTALMLSPVGRPTAENVSGSPSGSLATSASETVAFFALVWLAGGVSVGARLTLVTVQEKVLLFDRLPSDTVAVTLYVPALVNEGVPEIRPVAALTVSEGGSPVAL